MGPLEWAMGAFLVLYGPLVVVAIVVAELLRRGAGRPVPLRGALAPEHVAWLRAGVYGVAELNLVRLLRRGTVRPAGPGRVQTDRVVDTIVDPLDRALVEAARPPGDSTAVVLRTAMAATEGYVRGLRVQGRDPRDPQPVAPWIFMPVLAAATLGMAKGGVGLARGEPMGALAVLFVAQAAYAVGRGVLFAGPGSVAEATVAALRKRHAHLRTEAGRDDGAMARTDADMACALYGAAVFGEPAVAEAFAATPASGAPVPDAESVRRWEEQAEHGGGGTAGRRGRAGGDDLDGAP